MKENENENENEKGIRVIVVDDHSLFRKGARAMIRLDRSNITVTGEAESAEKLFSLLEAGTPAELILLDANLPDGMSGVEAARRLRCDYPAIKILAVESENTQEMVQEMLEVGIDGFISKQQGKEDELVDAIRSVMDGLNYFGRDISYVICGVVNAKSLTQTGDPGFTSHELDVIRLCRDGLMGKEIADRLNVSKRTVNTYKERIFQKIGLNSTIEMVNYALKNGIILLEN